MYELISMTRAPGFCQVLVPAHVLYILLLFEWIDSPAGLTGAGQSEREAHE